MASSMVATRAPSYASVRGMLTAMRRRLKCQAWVREHASPGRVNTTVKFHHSFSASRSTSPAVQTHTDVNRRLVMTASTAIPLLGEDFQSELSALRSRYEDNEKRDDTFPNSARELESIDILEEGQVVAAENGLAVITGFGRDTTVGSRLRFGGGAEGVLLWKRDPHAFAIILRKGGAPAYVEAGEAAQSFQVGTDDEIQKTDIYMNVRAEDKYGKVVDHFGNALVGDMDAVEHGVPTIALTPPPDREDRGTVDTSLYTGVKGTDVVTPLGRGQSMLYTGSPAAPHTELIETSILGLLRQNVHVVYVLAGVEPSWDVFARLAQPSGQSLVLPDNLSIVTAPMNGSPAEKYMATYTGAAIAEGIRDKGGDAVLVLNDMDGMTSMWETIVRLSPAPEATGTEEEMQEYEGMMVSAAAAERRTYFSYLIQRASKMSAENGGGSLSLLAMIRGLPGGSTSRVDQLSSMTEEEIRAKYKDFPEATRAKLVAALLEKQSSSARTQDASNKTATVEELMSISDGHVLIEDRSEGDSSSWRIRVTGSVSRLGNVVATTAVAKLASQLRLEVSQVADEGFAEDGALKEKRAQYVELVNAFLAQSSMEPVDEEDMVVGLYALQKDLLPFADRQTMELRAQSLGQKVRSQAPEVVGALLATGTLSEEQQARLRELIL